MSMVNRKIVITLGLRQFKTGKSRNIFAVIAISLTTILIAAVLTIGISLIDGQKLMMLRIAGRSSEVYFQYLTIDEAIQIGNHSFVEEYGLSTIVSSSSEGVFRHNFLEIRTSDEKYAKFSFQTPTTGQLPESENEVAVTSWILDEMGVPHELGQVIHLDFYINNLEYSLDLNVCGFWDSDTSIHPYGTAFTIIWLKSF